jgi:hypothetical protein
MNDDLVVQALQNFILTKDMTAGKVFWTEALEQARQAQPLGYHEDEMEHQGMTNIHEAQQALSTSTLLNVQLIVGFHPDQVTEACIDMALLLDIQYCVVPGCLFPSEFPNRFLRATVERVRSYKEMIPYLKGKYPDQVQTAELAFHETTTAQRIVLHQTGMAVRAARTHREGNNYVVSWKSNDALGVYRRCFPHK